MRRDALALRGKSEPETDTPLLGDFGFYHPFDYVRRAYLYLERGWGWPETGGWAEQDERLLDDLDAYHLEYTKIARVAEEETGLSDDYEDQVTEAPARRFEDL